MEEETADPSPTSGIPPYTSDDVFRRYNFLADRCERFLKTFGIIHPTWRLGSDDLVMIGVAQSALDDIWRFKSYHLRDPEKLSDSVKRAAFFTKWIVRFRPIYFNRVQSATDVGIIFDGKDTSLMVNEGFALHVSLITLATEIGVEDIHLDPDFLRGFLYDLHYRAISEDALLNIYTIIKNAAQDKSVVFKVF